MSPEGRDQSQADAFAGAAPYPEAGAVLIVSEHVSANSVAPAVVGWQVMHLLPTGEHQPIGGLHARLLAARLFAEATFANIIGWQRLGATVLAARVPDLVAQQMPSEPDVRPRRRANGLRIPLWRT